MVLLPSPKTSWSTYLIFSFSTACESVADTVFNAVWTLGCRPFMNSQRSACICNEEERDELWGRADARPPWACCQASPLRYGTSAQSFLSALWPSTGWGALGQAIHIDYNFWVEGCERGDSLWIQGSDASCPPQTQFNSPTPFQAHQPEWSNANFLYRLMRRGKQHAVLVINKGLYLFALDTCILAPPAP